MEKRGARLKGYLSVQEIASKWGVSVRWVNQYILAGRIPDCERFGHAWAVPEDAVKPERLTPGVKPKQLPSDVKSEKGKGFFFARWLALANAFKRGVSHVYQ